MAKSKVTICPYCGQTQEAGERCRSCGGLFESLSRQATHNAMGPWYIRDTNRPFQPGCSYETLLRMIQRGQISPLTIIRGPTTKQFWTIARHVPGVAHLLGYCHHCDAHVDPDDHGCHACGVRFGAVVDRNYLGLPELRPLPWEGKSQGHAPSETSALSTSKQGSAGPAELADQPRGGRLSSFATDEELLAPDDVDDQAWTGSTSAATPSPKSSETASEAQSDPAGSTTAVADQPEPAERASQPQPQSAPGVDDSLLRLARRRVLQLQSTTQKLWIALGLSIALNIMLASMFVFPGGEPAATPIQPAAQSDSDSSDADTTTPSQSEAVDNNSSNAPAATLNTTDDTEDSNPVADGQTNAPAPATDEPSPYEQILAQAESLIEAARDDDRELADRISDYEAAIKRLEDVRDNAPDADRPADIDAQIEQAERELERLRLREFFP